MRDGRFVHRTVLMSVERGRGSVRCFFFRQNFTVNRRVALLRRLLCVENCVHEVDWNDLGGVFRRRISFTLLSSLPLPLRLPLPLLASAHAK